MTGFTDFHAHFVYGVDDGPKTQQAMEAMLDAAWADGIRVLYATAHCTPGIRPFDHGTYQEHLEQARQYCQAQNYAMTLEPGAEILYTPVLENYLVNWPLPILGDSDIILMEFYPDVTRKELEEGLELVSRHGYRILLAHAERYGCLFRGNTLAQVKERWGIRIQVNAGTVLAGSGILGRWKLRQWFRRELVDVVASDAHDLHHRPFRLAQAYETLTQLYGQPYAQRLLGLPAPVEMGSR